MTFIFSFIYYVCNAFYTSFSFSAAIHLGYTGCLLGLFCVTAPLKGAVFLLTFTFFYYKLYSVFTTHPLSFGLHTVPCGRYFLCIIVFIKLKHNCVVMSVYMTNCALCYSLSRRSVFLCIQGSNNKHLCNKSLAKISNEDVLRSKIPLLFPLY